MAQPGVASPASVGSPVPTAMHMVIVTRLKDYVSSIVKQRKPWNEVVDRTAFSKPGSVAEATSRLRKNAAYFKVNYLIVMVLTTAATFIMHPGSLLVLGFIAAAWVYLFMIRTAPLQLGGRTISDREKLIGMSALTFITIFFLTSVGTVFFSALSLSLAVIAAHGAFREPDNLFIDDGETQQGLFNMFTAPAVPTTLATTV
ncbi:hypothetical protein VOLCADRAFT_109754 [Volvox carteri f. nagariensis]|uniref:PRA1 family protein n=1 Tax=Volvox carteri f. nagariensis TaxID=3068 RepID=D8TVH3_VOLCA|nr:uncharacterized protein VOLCADRAFT_109754 [Volvox carteri f. nagariensis]EFJ48459.1 hypothetical protein VOLCADRAFT_109754 [Volvox carteri f. nagariensis]|eukprot:XP_002950258.1 hypothetical protein VOLCADRAFT_109754 [Volvox carteri f. nagariensis]